MRLIKRAKLFVFLREQRHEIFDEEFQEELGAIYRDGVLGRPAIPPARLALVTILQAYTGVSDDEAVEASVMDRRWQLVLDCLGDAEEKPPFSKGTLVGFRKALIERDLDRRLVERTVARLPEGGEASVTGGCGRRWTHLLCGGRAGSRTPTTFWATPSGRPWA